MVPRYTHVSPVHTLCPVVWERSGSVVLGSCGGGVGETTWHCLGAADCWTSESQ
jgi:hypothetical protein